MSSKALRLPPKPASASATIGGNQSMLSSPLSAWISSVRMNALLMRSTIFGTESTGYRLWSGYISPALLPSPATCQPEQ